MVALAANIRNVASCPITANTPSFIVEIPKDTMGILSINDFGNSCMYSYISSSTTGIKLSKMMGTDTIILTIDGYKIYANCGESRSAARYSLYRLA